MQSFLNEWNCSKKSTYIRFCIGNTSPAKSLFASTCLQLNQSKIGDTFENMLGDNLINNENIRPKNLKYRLYQ